MECYGLESYDYDDECYDMDYEEEEEDNEEYNCPTTMESLGLTWRDFM